VKLALKAGVAGKTRMSLTAKGDNVPLPALGGVVLPLRVQLQGNGRWWEATFSADRAPATEVFRATSD
jgi:hypothetical protein